MIAKREKFIKLTLYLFNLLSFLIGVCLILIGSAFITVLKYENSYGRFEINIFTISILIIGSAISLLAFLLCYSLYDNNHLNIAIFTFGLILCTILLLSIGIWSYLIQNSSQFLNKIKTEINESINLYDESNLQSKETEKINLLQVKFKCCGLNSHMEWKSNYLLNKDSILRKEFLLNRDQIPFDLPGFVFSYL
jgi:hypothetical protein